AGKDSGNQGDHCCCAKACHALLAAAQALLAIGPSSLWVPTAAADATGREFKIGLVEFFNLVYWIFAVVICGNVLCILCFRVHPISGAFVGIAVGVFAGFVLIVVFVYHWLSFRLLLNVFGSFGCW